jgi:hypothetical protein
MNKELILFIAYEACDGNDFGLWKKNPFQYRHALHLIGVNLFIHIVQLVLLLGDIKSLVNGQLGGIHVVVFVAGLVLITYLMNLVFPKSLLAKAIKQYKGSSFEGKGKLIGFGYFFSNLALAVLISIWRH